VYVADAGSSYKDSKVIKFAPAVDASMNQMSNDYGYTNSTYGSYNNSTYGNTNYGTSTYGNTGYNTGTNYGTYSNSTTTTTDTRNIR
jgi:hypothetical protein